MEKKKRSNNQEKRLKKWNIRYLKVFIRSFKFKKRRGKNEGKKLLSLNVKDERRNPFANIPSFIKCRKCDKISKCSRKYKLMCDACRHYFNRTTPVNVCSWDAWGD